MTSSEREAGILTAWEHNAQPWTDIVRRDGIDSRRLVTNQAVLQVIQEHAPGSVLDIGCGEGWLARALSSRGYPVTGVDAVPELVERARQAGGGSFQVASFANIVAGKLAIGADLAVCNFALLGERGVLVIQTVHPLMACGDGQPYVCGWREERWNGFTEPFRAPSPWCFRTLQDWIALLKRTGWALTQLLEPLHPLTARPASLILAAKVPAGSERTDS